MGSSRIKLTDDEKDRIIKIYKEMGDNPNISTVAEEVGRSRRAVRRILVEAELSPPEQKLSEKETERPGGQGSRGSGQGEERGGQPVEDASGPSAHVAEPSRARPPLPTQHSPSSPDHAERGNERPAQAKRPVKPLGFGLASSTDDRAQADQDARVSEPEKTAKETEMQETKPEPQPVTSSEVQTKQGMTEEERRNAEIQIIREIALVKGACEIIKEGICGTIDMFKVSHDQYNCKKCGQGISLDVMICPHCGHDHSGYPVLALRDF